MAEGIDALTEKEKQALRLLLGGHDAKSMARQLGLSVHTVNERLRDTRRKLQVSSSKAAARLLREAEGPAPQLLGDMSLGDAGLAAMAHTADPRPIRSRTGRRAAWTIGGFAMITLLAALAISAPQPATTPAQAQSTTATPAVTIAESDASRAARDWLALVDARNWQQSWAATGASFRKVNTVANWQAAGEKAHGPLGPALNRELLADFDTPAAPNGVRTVRFRTSFADNRSAVETLSLDREGGEWRVLGIYLE